MNRRYWRLPVLLWGGCLLALFWASLAWGQQLVEEEVEELPEIDLNTAEFVALQKEQRDLVAGAQAPHRDALVAFLERHVAAASEMFEEARRTGNNRAMGVARDYQRFFTRAKEQLEETGSFELPEKIRRELAEIMETARRERIEVEAPLAPRLEEIEKEVVERFHALVKARAATFGVEYPEDYIAEKLKEFRETELVYTPPPGPPEGVPEAFRPPEGERGPILAIHGQGVRWVTIGRWTADMMGIDVITVDCADQTRDTSESRFNPMTNADSKTHFKAIRPMPAGREYAYRLKRLPELTGVDQVLEWPSERNRWRLVFRVKPLGSMVPEKHGFDFQVSLPDSELTALFGADAGKEDDEELLRQQQQLADTKQAGRERPKPPADDDDAKKTRITTQTKPPGVNIYVDDVLQLDRRTKHPLTTPCVVLAMPGKRNIRLEKPGYLPKEFKDFPVQPGRRIVWELVADPKLKITEFTVRANQEGWMGTGVRVKAGDMVSVQASGQWSCGDRCGPEGLPASDSRFRKYYTAQNDVRQNVSFPFGALLVRLGLRGTVRAVGANGTTFLADADDEVMLDINKLSGDERKGNSGMLTVNVVVPRHD